MQTVRTDNTITLYTYEAAIEIFKQQKVQSRRNIINSIYDYFIKNYIMQKIIGIIGIIFSLIFTGVSRNGDVLIFMFPICLGLVLINKKII